MSSIDKAWVENHIDSNGEVIIPDGIEKIEPDAFRDNEKVKKVIMPDTVIEIGDNAFLGCKNLEEIKFSSNLKNIGNDAFLDCTALKSIELPKSIEQIGEEAFARCEELKKVLIDHEARIKELQESIFYECKKLKELSIPESIEKIGEYAFHECSSLEKISIPDTLKEISSNAFSYCSKLSKIEIGENSQLKKLGDHAFYLCKALKEIKLPDTLKSLEKATFAGCYDLSSVDLGKGIETIDYDVFNSCKKLSEISFPDSLTRIGAAAFLNCEELKDIKLGQNIETIEAGAFENVGVTSFRVPSRVKEIDNVLTNCSNLEELYLGEETEQMISLALKGCTNLKKIVINDKLKCLPEMTLKDCKQLEEVEINGNQKIHYGAFKGKDSIRKITIDGKEFLLGENEQLFSLQRHNQNVAIVVRDKDGALRTRCINMQKGTETKQSVNIYLANDGSVVRSVNSLANISLDQLKMLKERGEKRLYLYGATRDIKPAEIEKGVEYDLYNIDDLIQIKTMIQEVKKDILVPPKEDKHRQKKIYSQIVRKLSEKMEYDFYEEYLNANSDQEKEAEKIKYEKMTGKNWEEYLQQNTEIDIEKTMIEDGNLLGFLNGKAVCRGNVEIIRNLAAEFGIEATAIIGRRHTWNQIKLDGIWYDDDFTNYQSYLAQGDLEKSSKRFLCGQVNGESIFSKLKTYSKPLNQPTNVGKNYSLEDKKFLLNYGRDRQQTIQQPEKEKPQEESIKDEIGDEFKPKTEQQKQEERQVESMWQNRFQSWDRDTAILPDGTKKKSEAVQVMQDLQRQQDKEKQDQEQLDNQNNDQR